MCGRFFLSKSGAEIARHFDLSDEPALAPRFNIAPSQDIPVVRANAQDGDPRVLELRRWGFVPRFAKNLRTGRRPINARAETAATSPLFRGAFARRRGLVPASGFYEWQHRGRSARPFALQVRGGELFAMAALFDRCEAEDGVLDSCAIVTTEANDRVAIVHDRMPAILAPADYALWLDPSVHERERLLPLLRPCPADWIEAHPVEPRVNDVHCDDPQLIEAERDWFASGQGEAT
jgi:putative SOS response-associated peptidase YedK